MLLHFKSFIKNRFFLVAPCDMWDLSSLTRIEPSLPWGEAWNLNHWTARSQWSNISYNSPSIFFPIDDIVGAGSCCFYWILCINISAGTKTLYAYLSCLSLSFSFHYIQLILPTALPLLWSILLNFVVGEKTLSLSFFVILFSSPSCEPLAHTHPGWCHWSISLSCC